MLVGTYISLAESLTLTLCSVLRCRFAAVPAGVQANAAERSCSRPTDPADPATLNSPHPVPPARPSARPSSVSVRLLRIMSPRDGDAFGPSKGMVCVNNSRYDPINHK